MSRDPSELLGLLLEQATEHALILLDAHGVIVAWLAGAETIFGYSASEIIGQRHTVLFTPEDVQNHTPEKELAIADSGAPAEDDRWMRRKDGSRFWATGVLQGIRAGGGELLGYGKILRNRTDLKGQLESFDNEIERLKRSDERKNTFISTLSHELRNPLSSLAGAVELLQAILPDSDDATFALGVVRRQLDSMRRLVDDLLDVTRISVGKLKLALQEESLGDIVQAAVETLT
jgi:two-component system CheB/CheR fusion protein